MQPDQDLPPRIDRPLEALRVAQACYDRGPTWVAFFRETFSKDGVCERLFPDYDDRRAFRRTPQYRQIVAMLDALRTGRPKVGADDVQSVITVRLPRAVHKQLRRHAVQRRQSLNRLCVDALLELVTDYEPGPPAS